MAKKQMIEEDLDLVDEDDNLDDEIEEAPQPAPRKRVTKKTSSPKTRYAPVKAESGLEDVLKVKQDVLKGMTIDNMTELERRRWDQMNSPPEENNNNAVLMAMAQNPQMFEGMDPNMRAMMIASMTNPQMGQMLPLMMMLKPQGNAPGQQQNNGMDLPQILNLAQMFSKMMQPQLPAGPSPQQLAIEDQIRRLEMQIRNQGQAQKPQSDPMLMNLITQQQKNLEMLAQKLDSVGSGTKDPLEAFTGMMSMFERFKGFVGAGPVSEQDIKLRQLEQNFKQKEIERDYDLKKRALEAQAQAAKNSGMAQVIQNGISQFADKFAGPIANIFQQTIKEKMDQSDEPAVLPISSINEESLNRLVTPPRPQPISQPQALTTPNTTPGLNPFGNPPPTPMTSEPMPSMSPLPTQAAIPTKAEEESKYRSGIVPMYDYRP
jgi:hypothetical protein